MFTSSTYGTHDGASDACNTRDLASGACGSLYIASSPFGDIDIKAPFPKLGNHNFKTVKGVGYKFEEE